MRFSVVAAIAAFGSTVIAQNLLGSIPTCAQDCFGGNTGDCSMLNVTCICSSEIIGSVSCCVFDTCNEADINSTITFAEGICGAEGVDVNTSPDCPNNSASGSQPPTASATGASGSTTPAASDATASAATGSAADNTAAAAPLQTAGAGAFGLAMAGLLALL